MTDMKREYDFTGAEQGKFFTPKEKLVVPFYLKPELERSLRILAAKKGKSAGELLETILEKELRLLESIG